ALAALLLAWPLLPRALRPSGEDAADAERPRRALLGPAGRAVALAPALGAAALLLALLVHRLEPSRSLPANLADAWSLAGPEVSKTLSIASAAATLCAALGLALGHALATLRRPLAARLGLGALFLLPGPVWGVALALLLRPEWAPAGTAAGRILGALSDSHAPLLAAYCLRFAGLSALAVEFAWRRSPSAWRDTALSEGAGAVARLRLYGWPLLAMPLAAAWVLTFALCAGDAGAAVLLLPPGTTTGAVRLLTLMHFAPQTEVAGLCLLLCLPALPAGLLLAVRGFGLRTGA
ncbi:MAG: hypothetical protein SF028_14195, partial [Candidatus Sumerlaeia bacterium]|nr:hypothetical protein [Candidatus Sumerlaeia bacterium]